MVRVLELRKNNPGGFRELGKVDKTDVMRLAFCKIFGAILKQGRRHKLRSMTGAQRFSSEGISWRKPIIIKETTGSPQMFTRIILNWAVHWFLLDCSWFRWRALPDRNQKLHVEALTRWAIRSQARYAPVACQLSTRHCRSRAGLLCQLLGYPPWL